MHAIAAAVDAPFEGITVTQRAPTPRDRFIDWLDTLHARVGAMTDWSSGHATARPDAAPQSTGSSEAVEATPLSLQQVLRQCLEGLIRGVAEQLVSAITKTLPLTPAIMQVYQDRDVALAARLRTVGQALDETSAGTRSTVMTVVGPVANWLRVMADAVDGLGRVSEASDTLDQVLAVIHTTQTLLSHEAVRDALPADQYQRLEQGLNPLALTVQRMHHLWDQSWEARLRDVAQWDDVPEPMRATAELVARLMEVFPALTGASDGASSDAMARTQAGLVGAQAIVDYLAHVSGADHEALATARELLAALPGTLELLQAQDDAFEIAARVIEHWQAMGVSGGGLASLGVRGLADVPAILRLAQRLVQHSRDPDGTWMDMLFELARDTWVQQQLPGMAALSVRRAEFEQAAAEWQDRSNPRSLMTGIVKMLLVVSELAASLTTAVPGGDAEWRVLATLRRALGLIESGTDARAWGEALTRVVPADDSGTLVPELASMLGEMTRVLTTQADDGGGRGGAALAMLGVMHKNAWLRAHLPQTFATLDTLMRATELPQIWRESAESAESEGVQGALTRAHAVLEWLSRTVQHGQQLAQGQQWESLAERLTDLQTLLGGVTRAGAYLSRVDEMRRASDWSVRLVHAKRLATDLLRDPAARYVSDWAGHGQTVQWAQRWLEWSVQLWAFPLDAPIHRQLDVAIRIVDQMPLGEQGHAWFGPLKAYREQLQHGLRLLMAASEFGQGGMASLSVSRDVLGRYLTWDSALKSAPWVAGYWGAPYAAATLSALNVSRDVYRQAQALLPENASLAQKSAAYASLIMPSLPEQIPGYVAQPLRFLATWTRVTLSAPARTGWLDTLTQTAHEEGGLAGTIVKLWMVVQVVHGLGTDDPERVAQKLRELSKRVVGAHGTGLAEALVTLAPAGIALYRALPPDAAQLSWTAWLARVVEIVRASEAPALKHLRVQVAHWSEQRIGEAVAELFERVSPSIANWVESADPLADWSSLSHAGEWMGPLASALGAGYMGYHAWRRGNHLIAGLAALIASGSLVSGAYGMAIRSKRDAPAPSAWEKEKQARARTALEAYIASRPADEVTALTEAHLFKVTGIRRDDSSNARQALGQYGLADLIDRVGRFGKDYRDIQVEGLPDALREKLDMPVEQQYHWLRDQAGKPGKQAIERDALNERMYRILVAHLTLLQEKLPHDTSITSHARDFYLKAITNALAGHCPVATVVVGDEPSARYLCLKAFSPTVFFIDLTSSLRAPVMNLRPSWREQAEYDRTSETALDKTPLYRAATQLITNLLESDEARAQQLIRSLLDADIGIDADTAPVNVLAILGGTPAVEETHAFAREEIALGVHEVALARMGYQDIRIDDTSHDAPLPARALFNEFVAELRNRPLIPYSEADRVTAMLATVLYRELAGIRQQVASAAANEQDQTKQTSLNDLRDTIGLILSGYGAPRLIKVEATWVPDQVLIETAGAQFYEIKLSRQTDYRVPSTLARTGVVVTPQLAQVSSSEAADMDKLQLCARSMLVNALLPESTRRAWQAETARQAWTEQAAPLPAVETAATTLGLAPSWLSRVLACQRLTAFEAAYAHSFLTSARHASASHDPARAATAGHSDWLSVMNTVRTDERTALTEGKRAHHLIEAQYQQWCETALSAAQLPDGHPTRAGEEQGAQAFEPNPALMKLAVLLQRWDDYRAQRRALQSASDYLDGRSAPIRTPDGRRRRAARQMLEWMGLSTQWLTDAQIDELTDSRNGSAAARFNRSVMWNLTAAHAYLDFAQSWSDARRQTVAGEPESRDAWIDRLMNTLAIPSEGRLDLAMFKKRGDTASASPHREALTDGLKRSFRLSWTGDDWVDHWLASAFNLAKLNYEHYKNTPIKVSQTWTRFFTSMTSFKGWLYHKVGTVAPGLMWEKPAYTIKEIALGAHARDVKRDIGALATISSSYDWPQPFDASLIESLCSGEIYDDLGRAVKSYFAANRSTLKTAVAHMSMGSLIAQLAGQDGVDFSSLEISNVKFRQSTLSNLVSVQSGGKRWLVSTSESQSGMVSVPADWRGQKEGVSDIRRLADMVSSGLSMADREKAFSGLNMSPGFRTNNQGIGARIKYNENFAEYMRAGLQPGGSGQYMEVFFGDRDFEFSPSTEWAGHLLTVMEEAVCSDLDTLVYSGRERSLDRWMEGLDVLGTTLSSGSFRMAKTLGYLVDILQGTVAGAQALTQEQSEESAFPFVEYCYGYAFSIGLGSHLNNAAALTRLTRKAKEAFRAARKLSDSEIKQALVQTEPAPHGPRTDDVAASDTQTLLDRLAFRCRVKRTIAAAGSSCTPHPLSTDEWRRVATQKGWDADRLEQELGSISITRDYLDRPVLLYNDKGALRVADPQTNRRFHFIEFKVDADNLEWKKQLTALLDCMTESSHGDLRRAIEAPKARCHEAASIVSTILRRNHYAPEIVQLYFWNNLRGTQIDHVAVRVRLNEESLIIDPTISQFSQAAIDYAHAVYVGTEHSWEQLMIKMHANSVIRRNDIFDHAVAPVDVTVATGGLVNAPTWYENRWHPVEVAQTILDRKLMSDRLSPPLKRALANVSRTPLHGLSRYRSLFLETYDQPGKLNALKMRKREEIEAELGRVGAWNFRALLGQWDDSAVAAVAKGPIVEQIRFLSEMTHRINQALMVPGRFRYLLAADRSTECLVLWGLELRTKLEILEGQLKPDEIHVPAGSAGRTQVLRDLRRALTEEGAAFERALWEPDWATRMVARRPDRAYTRAVSDFYRQPVEVQRQRLLAGQGPATIRDPDDRDVALNLFKLMAERETLLDPTAPNGGAHRTQSYDDLVASLVPTKSYVVLVDDERLSHRYLLDFPAAGETATATLARPCYVLQSTSETGLLPAVTLATWLEKKGEVSADVPALKQLYSSAFPALDVSTQRSLLARLFVADADASSISMSDMQALHTDVSAATPSSWTFQVHEYTPQQFGRNLAALRANARPDPVRSNVQVSLSRVQADKFVTVRRARDTQSNEAIGYIPIGRDMRLYTSDGREGASSLLILGHSGYVDSDMSLPAGVSLKLLNAHGESLKMPASERVLTQRPHYFAQVSRAADDTLTITLPDHQTLQSRDISEDTRTRLSNWLGGTAGGARATRIEVPVDSLDIDWSTTKARLSGHVARKSLSHQQAYHDVSDETLRRVFVTGSRDTQSLKDRVVSHVGSGITDSLSGERIGALSNKLDTNRILASQGALDRIDVLTVNPGSDGVRLSQILTDVRERKLAYRDVIFAGCRVKYGMTQRDILTELVRRPGVAVTVESDVTPVLVRRKLSADMSTATEEVVGDYSTLKAYTQYAQQPGTAPQNGKPGGPSDGQRMGDAPAVTNTVQHESDHASAPGFSSHRTNPAAQWDVPVAAAGRAADLRRQLLVETVYRVHQRHATSSNYQAGLDHPDEATSAGWRAGMSETDVMRIYRAEGEKPVPNQWVLGALYAQLVKLRDAQLMSARAILTEGSIEVHNVALPAEGARPRFVRPALFAMAVALHDEHAPTLISRQQAYAYPGRSNDLINALDAFVPMITHHDVQRHLIKWGYLDAQTVTAVLGKWMSPVFLWVTTGGADLLVGMRPGAANSLVLEPRTYYLYDPSAGLAVFASADAFQVALEKIVQPVRQSTHQPATLANLMFEVKQIDVERLADTELSPIFGTFRDRSQPMAGEAPLPALKRAPFVFPAVGNQSPVSVSARGVPLRQYVPLAHDVIRVDLGHSWLYTTQSGQPSRSLALSAHGSYSVPETMNMRPGLTYVYLQPHNDVLEATTRQLTEHAFTPLVELSLHRAVVNDPPNYPLQWDAALREVFPDPVAVPDAQLRAQFYLMTAPQQTYVTNRSTFLQQIAYNRYWNSPDPQRYTGAQFRNQVGDYRHLWFEKDTEDDISNAIAANRYAVPITAGLRQMDFIVPKFDVLGPDFQPLQFLPPADMEATYRRHDELIYRGKPRTSDILNDVERAGLQYDEFLLFTCRSNSLNGLTLEQVNNVFHAKKQIPTYAEPKTRRRRSPSQAKEVHYLALDALIATYEKGVLKSGRKMTVAAWFWEESNESPTDAPEDA
ncbi:cycle-inhibiting factor [Burkholderia sp. MS455]|uniref:cycle-inhibiting factor n=1 Tax=Burkholderia sp. MS455 TaxID=2811788 RepID=UPI001959F4F4|nr:cycle-inhibiting factor [Burkholderia sp. MS455]